MYLLVNCIIWWYVANQLHLYTKQPVIHPNLVYVFDRSVGYVLKQLHVWKSVNVDGQICEIWLIIAICFHCKLSISDDDICCIVVINCICFVFAIWNIYWIDFIHISRCRNIWTYLAGIKFYTLCSQGKWRLKFFQTSTSRSIAYTWPKYELNFHSCRFPAFIHFVFVRGSGSFHPKKSLPCTNSDNYKNPNAISNEKNNKNDNYIYDSNNEESSIQSRLNDLTDSNLMPFQRYKKIQHNENKALRKVAWMRNVCYCQPKEIQTDNKMRKK